MAFSAGAAGGAGAILESAGGTRGLADRRARPAGRYPKGGRDVSVEVLVLEGLER